MAKYITLACKLMNINGIGQYAKAKFRNQDNNIVNSYAWVLHDIDDKTKTRLQRNFHFVKFKIRNGHMYVIKYIEMSQLSKDIINERFNLAKKKNASV